MNALTFQESAFPILFAAYLAADLLFMELSSLVTIHHLLCLVGHLIILMFVHHGIQHHFAGIMLLELGSGACNVFYLYPQVAYFADFWFWGMAASNVAALICACYWTASQPSFILGVFGFTFVFALAFLRQYTALEPYKKFSAIFDDGHQYKVRKQTERNTPVP